MPNLAPSTGTRGERRRLALHHRRLTGASLAIPEATVPPSTAMNAPTLDDPWPENGLQQVDACPVCGFTSRHLLYSDLSDRSYLCAPGRWDLFQCESCSCAYLDPRPDERTAYLAYGNYYEGATGAPRRQEARRRSFRHWIRNGYLNSQYGYRSRPASWLGPFLVPLLPRLREKADEHVRHLRLPPGAPRLLDVGCGEGEFLADMHGLGWSVQGIEPNADAVSIARTRGLSVLQGTLSEAVLEDRSLDAVTFRLVFEHLRDPFAALRACHRALKPDGVLWIATPSLDSEAHRLFGEHWIHLQPPRHPVVYSPMSLLRLLMRSGFTVISQRPSRQALWSFRLSAAMARGLPPFRQVPPISRRLAVQARIADLSALRRPGLADVIVVVAQKV